MTVVIIDYGAGNVKSIEFAFRRLGVYTILSNNKEKIQNADKVVFPGVGEASSAMRKLKQANLHNIIPQLTQPVLGICLGMQLLCNSTEENNTKGLKIFNADVKRFSNDLKVPQIGWNSVYNLSSELFNNLNEKEYMYLVHSYYVPITKTTIASSNYGLEYSSALQKDNFYGVQFHPEKSSKAGSMILQNFLNLNT